MRNALAIPGARRRGLTLLELTVALAIVAVAGVYLLGVVRQVQRGPAQRIRDQANRA